MFHCTGVKVCEFFDPEVENLHHYTASSELFERIEEKREELYAHEVNTQPQRQSLGYVY